MKFFQSYLFMLLTILIWINVSIGQKSKYDSLLLVLKTAKQDTNKVNTLNDLSYQSYLLGNYDKEMKYAEKALRVSQHLNYKKGIAKSLNSIGGAFEDQGNYPQALKNYIASLKIREEIRDKKGMASSYNNIGNIYRYQGNYPESLKNQLASLKIEKEIGNKNGIAASYNNIGLIYDNLCNYTVALKNYFESLKIFKEIRDKIGISTSYNNIGIIYERQGNYPEALKNHFACLKISEETGDKQVIAMSYTNIGIIYKLQGDSAYVKGNKAFALANKYPEALKNHFASLKIEEEIGDKAGIAGSYVNLGAVYTKFKRFTEAKKYLNDALALSREIGYMEWIKDSYRGLSFLDSALGNFKQAFENYKMYIICRDKLLNEENTKKTVQTQMQYEFDVIQTADSIKVLEKTKAENFKHQQEVKQQKIYTYGGIIGFGLMLVVAIVSLRAFKNKQKANLIIAEQKLLVEEKQKEVMDSIRYAKRIQIALLPSHKYIDRNIKKLKKIN